MRKEPEARHTNANDLNVGDSSKPAKRPNQRSFTVRGGQGGKHQAASQERSEADLVTQRFGNLDKRKEAKHQAASKTAEKGDKQANLPVPAKVCSQGWGPSKR